MKITESQEKMKILGPILRKCLPSNIPKDKLLQCIIDEAEKLN